MGHSLIWWIMLLASSAGLLIFLAALYLEVRDLHKMSQPEEDEPADYLISTNFQHRGRQYAPGGGNSKDRRYFRRHGHRREN